MSTSVRKEVLLRTAARLLNAGGFDKNEARIIARVLVWSDLTGRFPQGCFRIPVYADLLRHGLITSPAAFGFTERSPSIAHLDAGNGCGHIAGDIAMKRAIRIAGGQGIGMVTVSNSNHYGNGAYYPALAAEAGMIGITMTNAAPKVAPHGGKIPLFGTNPIGFGSPSPNGKPILVDLSTSALSGSQIRMMKSVGGRLPEGIALDREGNPTTDPDAIKSGCLLPFGGPKGTGLGIMVEVFSALLTGAGMSYEVGPYYDTHKRDVNIGHVFLAIRIDACTPLDEFLGRTKELVDSITGSPSLSESPVRYPGQIRGENRLRYESEGIPLPEETIKALSAFAARHDMEISWDPAGPDPGSIRKQ